MRRRAQKKQLPVRLITKPEAVFINIPYSSGYDDRLLALISALSLYGLIPTAAVVGQGASGLDRLERIISALRQCTISIHDLSWMELDATLPPTPRFNMPFELGIAIGLVVSYGGDFVILDTVPNRLQKALSDASGLDVELIDDSAASIFRAVANVFHRYEFQPEPRHFIRVYKRLQELAIKLKGHFGYATLFEAKPFAELRRTAAQAACTIRKSAKTRRTSQSEDARD